MRRRRRGLERGEADFEGVFRRLSKLAELVELFDLQNFDALLKAS